MPSNAEAVEALMALGLSEYEARAFVALTRLSTGTASEISQLAEIPQSRVYDVTEQLHQEGLIDIQESDPKQFFALPVAQALETLQKDYQHHIDTATEHLEGLEGRDGDEEGVWAIANREDVVVRVGMHLDHATDEVYLVFADEALLEADVWEALADAHDRDVTIYVEVPTESLRSRIHERLPAAEVVVTDFSADHLVGPDRDLGRLLMVDREVILLSALQEGLVPDDVEETGVWGTAVGHGLVVWVRFLLGARRERLPFETADG